MITAGGNNLTRITLGSTDVSNVYLGNSLVYSASSDYALCNYIQNTSTSYIDTGIGFLGLTTPKMEVDIGDIVAPSAWRAIFGSRWKASDVDSCLVQLDTNNVWTSFINGINYRLNTLATYAGRNIVRVESNMTYVNNYAFTNAKTIPRYSAATMTLLATHNLQDGSIADTGLKCKIYGCRIYSGGNMIRNFVPAMQVSTGKYGLYDIITGVFKSSANANEFAGG